MKIMFILAVLFASLFVVTGAAFATGPSCTCVDQCFKVTGTDVTDSANTFMQDWSFCYYFDGDSLGFVCNQSGPTLLFGFSFFDQGLNDQAAGIGGGKGAYMTFHGSDDGAFNGLYYDGTHQYKIHGVEEPCIF